MEWNWIEYQNQIRKSIIRMCKHKIYGEFEKFNMQEKLEPMDRRSHWNQNEIVHNTKLKVVKSKYVCMLCSVSSSSWLWSNSYYSKEWLAFGKNSFSYINMNEFCKNLLIFNGLQRQTHMQ